MKRVVTTFFLAMMALLSLHGAQASEFQTAAMLLRKNGNERPRLNLNQSAGLDISPSVRDYLGMGSKGIADWKFVEASEVPPGPWTKYGENNTFVLQHRGANLLDADPNNANGILK